MILEAIFRGNLAPLDLVYPNDPEYQQLSQEAIDLSSELAEELTPTSKAKLDQLTARIYSAQSIESEAFFTFGLAIGARLQQEITEQLKPLE